MVSRYIAQSDYLDRKKLIENIKISIERNFGGKLGAANFIGESFAKKEGVEDMYKFI